MLQNANMPQQNMQEEKQNIYHKLNCYWVRLHITKSLVSDMVYTFLNPDENCPFTFLSSVVKVFFFWRILHAKTPYFFN